MRRDHLTYINRDDGAQVELCYATGPERDFEVETGLDVIDTAQSLIRDLRDVQAVRIEAPYQHKWFFYFSEGQFEGDKEKINDIWFSINLETGNRLGYFGNAFLKNQKNAEGSVHSRNRIEFMRRANIRHAQTDSIRVGSYIGYRSGGQPHILDLKKRVELLQRQLAKYKDCIKAETFDRIT